MGLTIHYRGTLDELTGVEEFEDCMVQLAFAMGSKPTIWRSFADDSSGRVIRGVLIDVAPGVETLSLLLSPEGHFIPLFDIEQAEQSPVDRPPICSVKTQYGTPLSHVCVVLILKAIQARFASNLVITDEGNYFESGDFQALVTKQAFLAQTISSLSSNFSLFALTAEAAEDPQIVASRIERITLLINAQMRFDSSASKPSSADSLDESSSSTPWDDPTLEEEVDWFERNRRRDGARQERMLRTIAEAIAQGQDPQSALRAAMQAEGLPVPDEPDSNDTEPSTDEHWQQITHDEQFLPEPNWQSVDANLYAREFENTDSEIKHPAVAIAEELLIQLTSLPIAPIGISNSTKHNFHNLALSSLTDCLGGLIQATSFPTLLLDRTADATTRALVITQLRRALRAQATTRAALFALEQENSIDAVQAKSMLGQLDTVLNYVHQLAAAAWEDG